MVRALSQGVMIDIILGGGAWQGRRPRAGDLGTHGRDEYLGGERPLPTRCLVATRCLPTRPPPPLQLQAELRRLRDLLDQQQGYKNFQRLEAEVRRERIFCYCTHHLEWPLEHLLGQ